MPIKGIIKKGEYYDSVSLMIVAKKINELQSGIESAVVMGTKENKAILENSGMLLEMFSEAGDSDLLIVVKAETEDSADKAFSMVEELLIDLKKQTNEQDSFNPSSLEGALNILPDANFALISVAGKYAAKEARNALEKGLNVMLFSDNVSLEDEIELKKYAVSKGLFVMGPDCGTAIINCVPLAFANVVNHGSVGIVAASGTGLQEVSTLISNAGGGISQAIGTGGRDVKKEVGGLMFIQGIKALAEDDKTEVILLVSKPPHQEVLEKIAKEIKGIDKPVVAVFLGADKDTIKNYGMLAASTLDDASNLVIQLIEKIEIGRCEENVRKHSEKEISLLVEVVGKEKSKFAKGQKYLRALYSGGTFCSEAQVLLGRVAENVYSNAPFGKTKKLKDIYKSQEHSIIDLGEDEFTVGKPHPMIDFTTRNQRILEEAQDPETAVILLDLVLGFGANMDPLPEIVPIIREARHIAQENGRYLPILCSVTGTNLDPQNKELVVSALNNIGVMVFRSNAQACKFAALTVDALGGSNE